MLDFKFAPFTVEGSGKQTEAEIYERLTFDALELNLSRTFKQDGEQS